MQFTVILQVALLFACQGGAIPVPESVALTANATIEMLKRAEPAPVSCGLELEPSPRMIDPRARY